MMAEVEARHTVWQQGVDVAFILLQQRLNDLNARIALAALVEPNRNLG